MARKHYANALMSSNDVHFDQWMESIRAQHEGAIPKDHVHRIAKRVLQKVDPRQYLLSHATIVASVDVREPPEGVKVGRRTHRGMQIDVRYPNFRINPEGFELVNNNGDAWERSLLLSSYKTFVGAHNYLEHIQLPELSKGFIVDAIARDLGSTCYIDILVATDRKHTKLINDILSGDMYGLSMGCISLFTICTECGNVATDDTQTCPCIMQGKGRTFIDSDGVNHPVSELIGHVSVPNSNQFIEASWVKSPAFRGAVRRNILNPDSVEIASNMEAAARVYEIRKDALIPDEGKRAASNLHVAEDEPPVDEPPVDEPPAEGEGADGAEDTPAEDEDIDSSAEGNESPEGGPSGVDFAPSGGGGGGGADGGDPESSSKDGEPADSKEMVQRIKEMLLKSLMEDIAQEMKPSPEDVGQIQSESPDFEKDGGGNDNLVRSSEGFSRKLTKVFPQNPKIVKWASKAYADFTRGPQGRKNFSSSDLIVLSWVVDRVNGCNYPPALYKVAMNVGPVSSFPSENSYLAACKVRAGRNFTNSERRFLMWKGKVASLAEF